MKIIAFVNTNGDIAQASGTVSTNIRLVAVPGAQGPNAAVFKNGIGNGLLEIQNASADAKASLVAGQMYEITIEPAAPPSP